MVSREQELWAMALWVERHKGSAGPRFIAEKMGEMALAGETGGIELWRGVASKFDQLRTSDAAN